MTSPGFRWQRAEDGAPALFAMDDLFLPDLGTGRMSDLEFIHVNAKRILNHVPGTSRAPANWTINVYRGCSHACAYCLAGDTRILTADGRTKSLADVRPGDKVYGTIRRGSYRRYVPTEVLDHWSTVRDAWRVTLEDGTELVASGDHRFLTNRGWKYVSPADPPAQRPHLTVNNELLGPGQLSDAPVHCAEYRRGYLCGIIPGDASLASYLYADSDILAHATDSAASLGFRAILEPVRPNGVRSVRIVGGLRERLRFLFEADPVIARKRLIDDVAVKSDARLRVVSVEPLHIAMPMYDITTGTGDFIANGVVSHNCFARPTHEYLGFDIGEDFDRKIVVKINAVEKLRAELADPRWTGETVAMGTNTDPYQRAEAKYRLTRGVLEALTDHGNPFSILTKSPLVVRDLDVITRAAGQADVSVYFSIGTLDERVWRLTEPGAPHPRRRIEAMAKFAQAGIRTGALVAPVLPGLSDGAEQLREVVAAIRQADGHLLGIGPLHLRRGLREHFLEWLAGVDPALHTDYLRRYADRSYAPEQYLDLLYERAGLPRRRPRSATRRRG